jgi:C-terminal peptidase prc
MRPLACRTFAFLGITIGLLWGASTNGEGAERTSPPPAATNHDAFAHRVFLLTDLILENHIDPPTRQEMILGGFRGLLGAAKSEPLPTLSRKVSDVRTVEELSALFSQVWPAPVQETKKEAKKDNSPKPADRPKPEDSFVFGLFQTVPGIPNLVSVKEARAETQIQANRYVGLGIAIAWQDKGQFPSIQKLIEGGSAELGGMHEGDLIQEIDHAPVSRDTMKLRDVVERLRGEEGSKVTLLLGHPDSKATRTITFVRLPVMFRSVHELKAEVKSKLPNSSRIGVLQIDRVSASTAQELRAWEIKLQNAGAQAVVLDLRGVGDVGPESYHSAVLLADSLLDGKPIGKLRTRERVQEFAADREALFRDMPLAILVNKHTGGAAEWVAAALQDSNPAQPAKRRAVIVGQPTHGANLITSAIPVPGGEVLMVATAVWDRPDHARAQAQQENADLDDGDAAPRTWRVTPDVYVEPLRPVHKPAAETAPAAQKKPAAETAGKKGDKPAAAKDAAGPRPPVDGGIEGDTAPVNAAIAELVRQLKSAGNGK